MEEIYLQIKGEIADLVEENRPTNCCLNAANPARVGISEGALFVSK
jgi:hypothetical protein